MFIKYTSSGREINLDERIEEEKDNILFQLYQFHYNIFNPKDVPMSLKTLSQAVELSEKRVKDICQILEDDKFIRKIQLPHATFYKITGYGIQFVEKIKALDNHIKVASWQR